MRLLFYFQGKFQQIYKIPYPTIVGRDLAILKRVRDLFEKNEHLGDVTLFIDLCFEENKSKHISTAYLLKIVNRKLGFIKGQAKPKAKKVDTSVDLVDWLAQERKKVDGKSNNNAI